MHESENTFDPFAHSDILASAATIRVRRVIAPTERIAVWHKKLHAATLVFAQSAGVVVQIRKPPFLNALARGEHYAVPAGIDMAVYTAGGDPAHCVVFEFGESLAAVNAESPKLGYVIKRSREIQTVHANRSGGGSEFDYSNLRAGFSRMDVLAFDEQARLLLQGHGSGECVPWHSHDHVTDTFFCTRGIARVATRDPDRVFLLAAGDTCQVEPGMAHFVSGLEGATCEVLTLQWGGRYNYVER